MTSRRMRRLTLFHGFLAFVFNIAMLALSINIIASVSLGGSGQTCAGTRAIKTRGPASPLGGDSRAARRRSSTGRFEAPPNLLRDISVGLSFGPSGRCTAGNR